MSAIKSYLSLVKFSHTLFALPFAAIGFVIGLNSTADFTFDLRLLLLVMLCMVSARNAAMAFNRWADKTIDAKNERTRNREIPSGVISARNVLFFVVINCLIFIGTAYFINKLCFYLSPVALFIILAYSYTKRFSWLCHVFLGLGLALAPIGAYMAVTESFHILPLLYSVSVICWVAGFDIIYALQDIEFDKKESLKSIPSQFGISKALWISSILHLVCAICIIYGALLLHRNYGLDYFLYFGSTSFILLLVFQHWIIGKGDLSRVNLAFFTTNGIASVILAVSILIDFYCF